MMEKRAWNIHQQAAIDARGQSIVVSAAAGSGKTSVLAERVLKLIEQGEDIQNMLIVTFTNLAASEMRERIYNRLQEASSGSLRLAAQAEKCAVADISTLHAFCGRLIRDSFEHAGTSPAFGIADEVQTSRLKQAALEQVLEQAAEDERMLQFAQKFAPRGNMDNIKRIILDIYARAISLKDPPGWLESARAHFDGGGFTDELFGEYASMVRDAACDALPDLEARTALWLQSGFDAEAKKSEDDSAAFMRQAENISMESAFLPTAAQIFEPGAGNINKISSRYTNSANKKMEGLAAYQADFEAKVLGELAATAADGRFFIDLTQAFKALYAKLKRAKNLLDHDDTMHFALKALSNEEVAAKYRARYAHVFVDEYQDINEAQHAIILSLQRGGNDFLVGDVKQCIYTFRESNPDLLMRRCRQMQGGGLIEMNVNYRSAPAVVDFINGVMRHMMSADAGGVDYTGGQMLEAGAGGCGCVQIVLAGREEEQTIAAEAAEIAGQIKRLAAKGIAYSEIAVLRPEMRNSGRQIAAALVRAGIPAVNGFGAAEADFSELTVFKNLLLLIGGIRDDVALLSVMRYPHFGFNECDFAKIRLAHQPADDKSFFCAAETFTEDSPLGEKVKGFFSQIARYARLSGCMRVPDSLHKLRQEVNLRAYALTSPGAAACDAAISAFINAVSAQQPAGMAEVRDIAERLTTGRETQQNPKDAGGVYLTTIHKSKGLEFRAVILAGMHKKIDQRDVSGSVLVGRSLGLALDVLDESTHIKSPTLHKLAVARSLKREKISETVRLLYVGMTRAIEQLVLLGAGAELKEKWCETKPKGWQHSAVTHFDLLMPAVNMMCRGQGKTIESYVQIAQPESAEKMMPDKSQRLEEFFNLAKSAKPADIFEDYKYAQDIGVPSKLSVSALKRMSEKPLFRPAFVPAQADDITPAQRGTLTHTVLKHIGLEKKTQEQVRSLVGELEQRGVIAEGSQTHVDAAAICGFLQGGLAARARQAEVCLLEQPFCLQMKARECKISADSDEPVIIQGVIDLCFQENGKWVVVDYKTDAVSKEEAPLAAHKYAVQLTLYAQALARITRKPVAAAYVYFLSAGSAVLLK